MSDTVDVLALSHVNALVDDPDQAASFLRSAFGAPVLDLEASPAVRQSAAAIRHVGLGDTVVALIRPADHGVFLPLHAAAGPIVHSLAFGVADLALASERLALRGIRCTERPAKATGDARAAAIFDTMGAIGFNLELIEGDRPFHEVPALRDGALLGSDLSPLLHVELAVDDLDGPAALLRDAFGSGRIEEDFASFLSASGPLDIRHVNLGRVVLQYCRPRTAGNSWHDLAARRGKAIHNLAWLVRRMADVKAALDRAGARDHFSFMLDFGRLAGHENIPSNLDDQRMVDCRSIVGFDIELSETFCSNIDSLVFNPLHGWEARPIHV